MEPDEERDYKAIAAIVLELGFQQAMDRFGNPRIGFYRYRNTHAEIDLTACATDLKSIVKTAFDQFAEQIDNVYHCGIENDLDS